MKRKAGRGRTAWPAASRARAPARPAVAGSAPVPSAGGSRRTGPTPLGARFYIRVTVQKRRKPGIFTFYQVYEMLPSPSEKKAVIIFLL